MAPPTREEIFIDLNEYRNRLWRILLKTEDMDRIEKIGIRYENACRICNEYLKAANEEWKVRRMEQMIETR